MRQGRRRAGRKRNQVYISLILKVESVKPSYTFSINRACDGGRYSEHAALELRTTITAPALYALRAANFALMADRRQSAASAGASESREEPIAVASFSTRGKDDIQILGSVPYDAFAPLAFGLATNALPWIVLRGPAPKWGHGRIESMHFASDVDPDEW